ncbi:MAG: prepilin-type N-terminal cleavage/methylation domain-containing protein [Gammaproteobacteria bacterium]|nr:prepilin-type N-terminal cleavage/methylation domain-containing protein [Gammaproteobacteria bacterium]
MRVRQQHGFTLLELVVVIIIISTLLYFAIDRLLKLEVTAERAAMTQVIGNINSALAMVISKYIVENDIPGLNKYIDSNPMDLLAQTPPSYIGSYHGKPQHMVKGVNWYYDRVSHALVYVTGSPEYLRSDGPEKSVINLKIIPVYDDNNHNGRFDTGDTLVGLKLAATAPYHWYNQPLDPADFTASATR